MKTCFNVWFIPIVIFLLGIFLSWYVERGEPKGYLDGIFGTFILILFTFAAGCSALTCYFK